MVSLPPRILEITEAVGDSLQGNSRLVTPALALAVVDLPEGPFSNLSFGVSSTQGVLNPEVPPLRIMRRITIRIRLLLSIS